MTDIETSSPAAPANAAPINPAPAPSSAPAKKHTVNFAFLWLFVLLIVAALGLSMLYLLRSKQLRLIFTEWPEDKKA